MHSEEAVYVYERVLSGELKNFSPYFFAPERRKERITTVFKHLIENKLNMTPEKALNELSVSVFRKYKLQGVIRHIHSGGRISDRELCIKVLKYVYPSLVVPSEEDCALSLYKEILEGKVKSFPKGYFSESSTGEKKAIACLKYLCLEHLSLNKDVILEYFRNMKNCDAEKFLRKYKLWCAADTLYLTVLSYAEAAFLKNYDVNF